MKKGHIGMSMLTQSMKAYRKADPAVTVTKTYKFRTKWP